MTSETGREARAVEEVELRVFRGDRDGGVTKAYRVPLTPGMVVLDALHYIQAHFDSDLAVRWNCKAARCGSCSAEINGRPRLTCKARLDQYAGQAVYVGPMKAFPLIKDLVTDVSWNYRVNKEIPPFTPPPGTEPFTMLQMDVERAQEMHKCIECFLCQDVCHVLRDHGATDVYYGPRYMARIAGLELHPMDQLSRTHLLRGRAGIGYCNITKCCEELCPEHIHITDNAIIPLKERMADDFWDPVRALIRRLQGR
ncbi:MAG TPA: succinate dehydrogenase/fumarate reductase iron-sulfur subunit [Chloroflexota bacterium]|nr:succinate dehydrogenase/fumarate reductase iron-sulfur subunit [Chloroflexota bacterium]